MARSAFSELAAAEGTSAVASGAEWEGRSLTVIIASTPREGAAEAIPELLNKVGFLVGHAHEKIQERQKKQNRVAAAIGDYWRKWAEKNM